MIINKAILNVLDFNSDVYVFSETEMDVSNVSIHEFLEKHIEKSLSNSGRKQGQFLEESEFKKELMEYIEGEKDFITLSQGIASHMYDYIANSELPVSTDILVSDITLDNDKYLCILIFENKTAFTHTVVSDENGVRGEIIKHYSILPNSSQKVDEYAIINLGDFTVNFVDKKRKIEGKDTHVLPDLLLQCTSSISTKEAVKMVKKLVTKVTDEFGGDTTKAITQVKSYMAENLEESETLSPLDLGRDLFSSSGPMLQEFENKVKELGIPENIKVDKEYVQRSVRSHKIKTDTGIEITFPADYYNNSEYIEFLNNVDGTISIQLKNIGKIINR